MLVDEGKRSRDLETLLRNKGGTFLENHEDQDSKSLFNILDQERIFGMLANRKERNCIFRENCWGKNC